MASLGRRRLRLALGIISGRIKSLSADDFNDLGYDSYKFGHYGKPDEDELKQRAEDILIDAILYLAGG